MPKKFDNCVKSVQKKIDQSKIGKTYKCDSKGNPNPRGKKRCKTSSYAICKASLK